MKSTDSIEIDLSVIGRGLCLYIDVQKPNTFYDASESALKNNEARYQLMEGCFYDYAFNDDSYYFGNIGEQIVQPHKRFQHHGILAPNIFVGTLTLPILRKESTEVIGNIYFEVQSIKSDYRDDYRDMLELITEKCTDLLLLANSPVSHYFEIDYSKDSQTLYQKFAFIKSVIGTEEFAEAVHRIVTAPVTKWTETLDSSDVRRNKRFSNAQVKDIVKGSNRTRLPDTHFLRDYGLKSIPERIMSVRKTDSVDTPENRFIKHALETFLKFCTDINQAASDESKLYNESILLIRELESQLHHSVFKEISRPDTLKLNSPVLQRKEGYREVLRVWLMFDLAAKLIWTGGEDVYSGGKKDVATLYEYWLFFKLLDLFQSLFEIDPADISKLIVKTKNGLHLQLKQGKHIALQGVFYTKSRKLNVRFSYNRSFSGRKNYPDPGSWTTTLRPDYTLSFWPHGIDESEAEKQELIVHVHFDAKYKVANLTDIINRPQKSEVELDDEKIENRNNIYKNADLLKMHAYKDAIRRTGGAYVLYPGTQSTAKRGFHEIIPGLGAFAVRPSKTNSGVGELKAFILEVIDHFINRASQRERLAYRTFDIHEYPPKGGDELNEPLPETYGSNRGLIPDETYVLVGFCKSDKQYEWVEKTNLYNFRMGSGKGSLPLDKETVSATYLLLHKKNDKNSGSLWRIRSKGPKVWSKADLIKKGYPDPSQSFYLIIQVEPVNNIEFKDVTWDFRKLKNYRTHRFSAVPFTASLTDLMRSKVI